MFRRRRRARGVKHGAWSVRLGAWGVRRGGWRGDTRRRRQTFRRDRRAWGWSTTHTRPTALLETTALRRTAALTRPSGTLSQGQRDFYQANPELRRSFRRK